MSTCPLFIRLGIIARILNSLGEGGSNWSQVEDPLSLSYLTPNIVCRMVASPDPNNTVETISPAAACPGGTHMAGMYSMGTPTIPEAVRNCWGNATKKLD